MKPEIHPEYKQITVTCGCGNTFETGSVWAKDRHIEVCSSCHPFYTGTQRVVDTAGRVDKFRKKFNK
jgi:large subunit ribosomal protein L31